MFKLILYKELREIIGSKKFAATFGICSVLIILAFFTGIKNYQAEMRDYESSKAAQLQTFERFTKWDNVNKNRIFFPPEPLAYLVMGISYDIGRTADIDGNNRSNLSESIYSEQTVFAVFRFMDLEYVFKIILSLFAILFAFDAITGEKEKGTLSLSFSNAVPRANYILSKLLGPFLALILPLLVPILIGTLLLPLLGVVLSVDEWIRLGLFIVCGLLYIGVFLTLSVFISCLTKRSSSSFLFLLVIWVCSVLIIPRASVLIAGNMVKVPPYSEIYYKVTQFERQNSREANKQVDEFLKNLKMEKMQSETSESETTKKVEEQVNEFYKKLREENSQKARKFESLLNEAHLFKKSRQEKLALGLSRISPATVFTLVARTLGGTSLEMKKSFQKNAKAYSESFAEFIRGKTGRNKGGKRIYLGVPDQDVKNGKAQPYNPKEIPEFVYQPTELSEILFDALPNIAILILYTLIFFLGAFLAFFRYDLR
jgi:ABC-type transport system involved in multi-copper enzyme maturation permease subunit